MGGSPLHPAAFLHSYPRQYVARELATDEPPPKIDGRLDDSSWAAASWTSEPFADITQYLDPRWNAVPESLQARAKMRWDGRYLYVGAELRGQFQYAVEGPSHNAVAPYLDNDFEVFIGPSGSTQHYKEFEVSIRNATYDVLWGVPDGEGLACDSGSGPSYLPSCVNTSFHGYRGNWTMLNPSEPGLRGGGLVVATHYEPSDYAAFTLPWAVWTVEMAFPIRAGPGHGGLLSAGPETEQVEGEFDPATSQQAHGPFGLAHAAPLALSHTSLSGSSAGLALPPASQPRLRPASASRRCFGSSTSLVRSTRAASTGAPRRRTTCTAL